MKNSLPILELPVLQVAQDKDALWVIAQKLKYMDVMAEDAPGPFVYEVWREDTSEAMGVLREPDGCALKDTADIVRECDKNVRTVWEGCRQVYVQAGLELFDGPRKKRLRARDATKAAERIFQEACRVCVNMRVEIYQSLIRCTPLQSMYVDEMRVLFSQYAKEIVEFGKMIDDMRKN